MVSNKMMVMALRFTGREYSDQAVTLLRSGWIVNRTG